ncbi:hypothetical protein G7Z17_g12784 [Cylindrodendrum hubeiense]|uniref:Aspartate aminotransferase n=1 Tax=Cylindrodendrum hubeiense TaxID=595255 RepID=A0A9P5GYB5_9HYPO|nr:hypothetical protein G7Z17_g12784 [Cylindrodendrum hubeiense]
MSSPPAPSSFPANLVPQAPEDPLFGLAREYRADESPYKVDLGIGAYRDENAKPWVLPVVHKADEILRNNPELNHEYGPIAGIASFTTKAADLILGSDSPALKESRATSLQTISGTGAVHLGALFLAKFYQGGRTVYVSNPTWGNHHQIFKNVGLTVDTYPYFHKETKGLDFEGMKEAFQNAPDHSIFVLHACAHNPTGVDPTQDQWTEIAAIMREKNHFPFFDCAYQGFASGNLARDAWAVHYFIEQGFELVVAQSFAKNFGLYGERAGCFHAVTSPAEDAPQTIARIGSQLAILQRSEISNPPLYGARIVSTVLNDPELFSEWEENLRTMSGRIITMRSALRSKLEELETPGTWNHITDQIGMFSFTGLSEAQVMKIREEAHVYMTKNGRISMAGLNDSNVEYFAKAVDKVVREVAE